MGNISQSKNSVTYWKELPHPVKLIIDLEGTLCHRLLKKIGKLGSCGIPLHYTICGDGFVLKKGVSGGYIVAIGNNPDLQKL